MESAIPDHLRTERTRHRRISDDYRPPVPAYSARFKPAAHRAVMAYFGLQYLGAEPPAVAAVLSWLSDRCIEASGPSHWDRARFVDGAGYDNIIMAVYWSDVAAFDRWLASVRDRWLDPPSGIGVFLEAVRPTQERYETLFSSLGRPEGVAVLADGLSGEVQEHGYWGGMRDRIALSQTCDLAPSGELRESRSGGRVRIHGHDNLCLIRSGQDWGDAEDDERQMYLTDVEPVLRQGMDFLRDNGREIGCYANRYVGASSREGEPLCKSYGMSWWRSLEALERWAESHPTHVAIFGAAMKYLSTRGPGAKLRLHHEVTVVRADEQLFEYAGCHGGTGLLNGIPTSPISRAARAARLTTT